MNIPDEILIVAEHLSNLRDEVVFVGGMVREFLVTDPVVSGRPTKDVDVILNVGSPVQRAILNDRLRELGFREDMSEDAPICRYVLRGASDNGDLPVDFMPLDPAILGFSNVWYPDAYESAKSVESKAGKIRIIDAPHFLATKLESFAGRGDGDFYHHDLEDIVAIIDGRPELEQELKHVSDDVRRFLANEIRALLKNKEFLETLPGQLPPDEASQARLPIVLSRLEAISKFADLQTEPPRTTDSEASISEASPGGGLSWTPRRSSNIRHFSYAPKKRILTVTFHGGRQYEYYDVPQEVFSGWTQAASAGRYHHRWVKRYRYRRIH